MNESFLGCLISFFSGIAVGTVIHARAAARSEATATQIMAEATATQIMADLMLDPLKMMTLNWTLKSSTTAIDDNLIQCNRCNQLFLRGGDHSCLV